MASHLTYRQRHGLDTRIVDGEAFVITPVTIHHLNPVATVIWLILETSTTRRILIDLLAGLYPHVPRETLGADLTRTLRQLQAMHIIAIKRPSRHTTLRGPSTRT